MSDKGSGFAPLAGVLHEMRVGDGSAGLKAGLYEPEAEELQVCTACVGSGWRIVANEVVACTVCQKVLVHRLHQYFEEARIPTRFRACSFETFPLSPETLQAVSEIRAWAEDLTLGPKNKCGLFLFGAHGTGKTGLAVSLLRLWAGPQLFLRVPELLDALRATYARGAELQEHEVIATVMSVPLLVLDDLGAERATDWVREKLFQLVNHRHDELLNTIFTSNLSPDQLAGHIGERTAWRITEMCTAIHLAGPNLRAR